MIRADAWYAPYFLVRMPLREWRNLADAPDLGSGGATHGGSSPPLAPSCTWLHRRGTDHNVRREDSPQAKRDRLGA